MRSPAWSADNSLLLLCSVLGSFDAPLLVALGTEPAAAQALLASDLVVGALLPETGFRLQSDVQAEVLAYLRAEQPRAELELHTQAFNYLLQQLGQPANSPAERQSLEARCLYHLGELYLLLAARREWQRFLQYVLATRAAGLTHPPHLHHLAFYEAYVLVSTERYGEGEAALAHLLAQTELDERLRTQVLNALGNAHWYQTQYDRALSYYQRAYASASATDDLFFQGITLTNLGLIYNEISAYEQALDVTLQSLDLFERLGNRQQAAWAHYDIGKNAMKLGRWQLAQSHFAAASQLNEELENPVGLAYAAWGQGFLAHMLGANEQSEQFYQRALAQLPQQQELLALDTYAKLGLLYHTQQRVQPALEAYGRAIELATRLSNPYYRSLIAYQQARLAQQQGDSHAAMQIYRQALSDIETIRGNTEGESVKIGLLGTAQQVYEAAVLLCLEQNQPADAFELVERARSRAFLDALARKDPDRYDAFLQPIVTLSEVQAQLPAGTVLLEYFTIGVLPRGEHLISQLPPESAYLRQYLTLPPQLLLFAITNNQCVVHRLALDPNKLRPDANDVEPGRRLLRDRMLVYLYDHLIGPVVALLNQSHTLYLVPHGPLHYVPFMALRSAAGNHLLHADGPVIALAPSATILLRNCLQAPPATASGLIALGYNDEGADQLRFAEAEATAIARLVGGRAWVGSAAKSGRLLSDEGQTRWLHIAGHAVFNPRDPLASILRLGANDTPDARTIMRDLNLHVDLVSISACTSGLSHVVPGDELLGLQRAFLYAGAPTIICTLWEAADFVALLVMEQFYRLLQGGATPAAALRDAQVAVRTLNGRALLAIIERWRAEQQFAEDLLPTVSPEQYDTFPFADPYYWATFMLIGRA